MSKFMSITILFCFLIILQKPSLSHDAEPYMFKEWEVREFDLENERLGKLEEYHGVPYFYKEINRVQSGVYVLPITIDGATEIKRFDPGVRQPSIYIQAGSGNVYVYMNLRTVKGYAAVAIIDLNTRKLIDNFVHVIKSEP